MNQSYKDKLQSDVERFKQIQRDLSGMGLSEIESAVLSAKLMGTTTVTYDEDFHRIKSRADYKPYLQGIFIVISEISLTRGSRVVKFTRSGYDKQIVLRASQATLFLSLLTLKYMNSEKDATNGFDTIPEIDRWMQAYASSEPYVENLWDPRVIENLRAKLKDSGLKETIQRMQLNTFRLAISPLRIMFEEDALKTFNDYSEHSFEHFCKQQHFNPSNLRAFI
jgi:hypothetical protein